MIFIHIIRTPCTVHYDRGNEFGEPAKLVEIPLAPWYMDDFPHSEFIMTRTGMKLTEPDF